MADAHASRVSTCFATQLQDVSDLLDWWVGDAQADAMATSCGGAADAATDTVVGTMATSPAVATQLDVLADVAMGTQVRGTSNDLLPYSSDDDLDESSDSGDDGVCNRSDDSLDEDGRQVLDAVIASYAGSSTRRCVLQDGRESSDDGCDGDGDGSDGAVSLDDFDDDDEDGDVDEDSDDGFFVRDELVSDDNDDDDKVGNDEVGNDDVGSDDDRHDVFYNLLRGVAGGELVIREDMALASISAGSAVEFSLDEMQQLLRRCVEECEIMRSRGNIYFV